MKNKTSKTVLKTIKAELLKRQQELLDSQTPDLLDPSSQGSDEVDIAQSLILNDMAERLSSRDREELRKIVYALNRIEDKTFGVCEQCEEHIGEKRLQALPLSIFCVSCAEDRERMAKQFVGR